MATLEKSREVVESANTLFATANRLVNLHGFPERVVDAALVRYLREWVLTPAATGIENHTVEDFDAETVAAIDNEFLMDGWFGGGGDFE